MYLLFSGVLGWCFIRLFCLNASNLDHHPVAKKGYQHHRVDIGNTHQQSHVHQQKWNRPIKTSPKKHTIWGPTLLNIRKTRLFPQNLGPNVLIDEIVLGWATEHQVRQADCTEAGEAPCQGGSLVLSCCIVWWYLASIGVAVLEWLGRRKWGICCGWVVQHQPVLSGFMGHFSGDEFGTPTFRDRRKHIDFEWLWHKGSEPKYWVDDTKHDHMCIQVSYGFIWRFHGNPSLIYGLSIIIHGNHGALAFHVSSATRCPCRAVPRKFPQLRAERGGEAGRDVAWGCLMFDHAYLPSGND